MNLDDLKFKTEWGAKLSARQLIEHAEGGCAYTAGPAYTCSMRGDETAKALAQLLRTALARVELLEKERGIVKEWEEAQLRVLAACSALVTAQETAYTPALEVARLNVKLSDMVHVLHRDEYGQRQRALGLEPPPSKMRAELDAVVHAAASELGAVELGAPSPLDPRGAWPDDGGKIGAGEVKP